MIGDKLTMVMNMLAGRPDPLSILPVIGAFAIHPQFAMITESILTSGMVNLLVCGE